jgi:hypothetical protein
VQLVLISLPGMCAWFVSKRPGTLTFPVSTRPIGRRSRMIEDFVRRDRRALAEVAIAADERNRML